MHIEPYLPSLSFRKKIFHIAVFVFVIFLLVWGTKNIIMLVKKYKLRREVKNLPVEIQNQINVLTLDSLQKKDSNKNGIPDWEEKLYGLDPLINGEENKKKIELLREENGFDFDDKNQDKTETQKFAQSYLATILSLESNGLLNDTSIQNISSAYQEEIQDFELDGFLKNTDIKTIKDDQVAIQNYKTSLALELNALMAESNSELASIADFIRSDLESSEEILNLSNIYIKKSEDLKSKFTPVSQSQNQLIIVNSLYNIGVAFKNINNYKKDPILAMKGINQYIAYSESLKQAFNSITN